MGPDEEVHRLRAVRERFRDEQADVSRIEANANVVMLLYRKQYYVNQGMLDGDAGAPDVMNVMVSKNREGDTGTVRLLFDGPTFRLKEMT